MSAETFLNGRVQLCCGDSIHFLRDQPSCRYDSVVTDPPYALVSIVKRFANSPRSKRTENTENPYGRTGRGFMGQRWDNGSAAFSVEFWTEVLRTLKPGGHILAFGGTRTYHRLACAIEDAGFEIRDSLQWLYGSGFPKSRNVGDGWGTALKPACEPICLGRKPLSESTVTANVLRWGTGAINVDGCRVGYEDTQNPATNPLYRVQNGYRTEVGSDANSANISIKPNGGNVTANALGRWPANVVHDGSEEVIAAFPESAGQQGDIRGTEPSVPAKGDVVYGFRERVEFGARNDSGSAARFFYTAKADASDRIGSKHPTVKPVDLMQWLVRRVTPKGGLVLDPFAGTGTTAEACYREGMRCVLVEREAEYQTDIRRRMALIMAGPDERSRESIKAKIKDKPVDHGPLFDIKPEAAE